jgi:hypothetical protein
MKDKKSKGKMIDGKLITKGISKDLMEEQLAHPESKILERLTKAQMKQVILYYLGAE